MKPYHNEVKRYRVIRFEETEQFLISRKQHINIVRIRPKGNYKMAITPIP